MFSKLTTKIALRKVGLSSDVFSLPNSAPSFNNNPNGKDVNLKDANSASPSAFSNPFATLTVPKSWQSWQTPPPPQVEIADSPVWGTRAPSSAKLRLPAADGRPTVVVFLRHCGCPFAEKTFLELRRLANKHINLHFVAVSHSSKAATERWVSMLGGAWAVDVLVDEERALYASWGLGVGNTWHVLSPWTQWGAYKLGKEEGLWGREVDPSGNRWQVGGSWATDSMGTVRWGAPSKSADEIPDLVEGCRSLGFS